MIQVHVIASGNSHLYGDALRQYFACRHQVFIKEKGWADIAGDGELERDQFDNEHAVYLLAMNGEDVLGGQRFYPTLRPHMLSEVFGYLTQWPIPRDEATWEATRYCVAQHRRIGRADAKLLVAMQRFCLEEGISNLTGVIEVAALSRWLQAGFKLRPLGLPQSVGGQPTIAVIAEVTAEGYAKMLARLNAPPAELVRRDLPLRLNAVERHAA